MMKRVALALSCLCLALGPWLASASHQDVGDGNDTKGSLDIRRVDVLGKDRPRWKVMTFATWTKQEMWDGGYVLVLLDTRGDRRFDRYALVRSVGHAMRADLWRDRRSKPDYRVARLEVWRPNSKSVSVRVPLKKLDIPKNRAFYRWVTETLFTNRNCRRTCIDRAPDRGAVREVLIPSPKPSPSISISPSPSLTPSPSISPTP